ncbi:Ger(x)C family spore germination protein [Paenibacillus radicis (ex Gao et al. 2016)]|uniref:Spore germination protein YfkR n=1 Tax=Paenibacillus radicis (ex Gao et al. 2016) TaxID=1737354 RepID=A0A917M2D7_9BACL|nr:Ger(x)C family spore germination protein [Paenibacillus radicis (ex Gao et al. 2016)]GGG70634.1 putative spore germination protein YfkR [Paenibacillus radicis (ex Gao et al. 2016)]
MRKQVILFLTIFVFMYMLTGCWSRVELNDIAIVTAAALDLVDDQKIQLGVQVMKTKMTKGTAGRGESSDNTTLIFSEQGDSVMDAYRKIQKKIPRNLIFSHNRIVIIGEKLARSGITPVIEFFSRYRDVRGNSYLLTTKGKAFDLLNVGPNFEKFSAEEIREEQKARVIDSATIRDFTYRLLEEGIEPITSQLQMIPAGEKSTEDSNSEKKNKNNELALGLVGVGVYRKDRLIGWMNAQDAETLLWLRNKMKDSVITVMIPDENKLFGKLSVQLMKSKATIKSKVENEQVQFQVNIEMTGDLYENTTKLSTNSSNNLHTVQQLLEEEVERRIRSTVQKSKNKFKTDIIGFGSKLHRQNNKEWNEKYSDRWDEKFPEIKVDVTAHFKIIGTGRINDSLIWEEKEMKK